MTARVLVSLQPGASADRVAAALQDLGADSVQPPQPELPDVCVATLDEGRHPPQAWISAARRLPGVAEAELDQLRWST